VLAASRGDELGALTEDRPKCMIDVRGQPLLRRLVDTLHGGGVHDITVVRGYRKEMVNLPSVRTLDNDEFDRTGEAATLACAAGGLDGECLIAYGDILFRQHILDQLRATDGDIVLAADALWRDRDEDPGARLRDLVECSAPFRVDFLEDEPVSLRAMGPDLADEAAHGEWIGLALARDAGATVIKGALEAMRQEGSLDRANMTELFNRLVREGHDIRIVYIAGKWLDVDNAADLLAAGDFL
jgi:phosphoenolpyruvate phosphomutase